MTGKKSRFLPKKRIGLTRIKKIFKSQIGNYSSLTKQSFQELVQFHRIA
ncbi:MAG: hypothetical protein IGBAC_0541 [Ignavibacteriae bacterium]|nr:MAG: hypothetical protein IGBAC_0541 [Ignavibacteriota bacterium]